MKRKSISHEALAKPRRTAGPPSLPVENNVQPYESGGPAASRAGPIRGFARASHLLAVGLVAVSSSALAGESLIYRQFEVIDREGLLAETRPVRTDRLPLWATDVSQDAFPWEQHRTGDEPVFKALIPFVNPPVPGADEPFFRHNHQPDITWLPNGDLMAIWYTTDSEAGAELTVLASRLRAGHEAWDPSSEFFKAPLRNMHGSAIFHDGNGTIHHFNGVRQHPGGRWWARLALLMRTSTDNGVTWTVARPISEGAGYEEERAEEISKGDLHFPVTGRQYAHRHMPIAGVIQTRSGALILPCDGVPGMHGPTALHVSLDGGENWTDPGGDIHGIHAGVVELADGRLMALGRGMDIDERMPMSLSDDLGRTWTYRASPFPPIAGGQRLALMRLREGPILLVSFASSMEFPDAQGGTFAGTGLFAALSYDEGETWPVRKLITPGSGVYKCGGHTRDLRATPTRAESAGYLASTQAPDNLIHLISSRLHYRFNLAWLETPPEPVP